MSESRKIKVKVSKKKYILRALLSIVTAVVLALIFIISVVLVLEFGPSETARNIFVNSAMESSAGKILVTAFFSDEKVKEIMALNSVVATDDVTDSNLIVIDDNKDTKPDMKDLEIVEVSGGTYRGLMAIVKDAKRVSVGISGPYGSGYSGKTVEEMAQDYGAVLAVNGGGFSDPNGMGNGGTPIGIVISDGELKYGSRGGSYELIGFDEKGTLVVGTMTGQQALDRGVVSALSFGPILIVNGEPCEINGKGSGLNPRTAIGQRADGSVLILTIDGRQGNSLGASYSDLIEIMMEYGAVNAANLDGGSSTLMYYQGEYINNCSSLYGPRAMPTCIVVK